MKIIRESSEANSAIETMMSSFDEQESPKLGIFWYDIDNEELFGVYTALPDDRKFYKSPQWGKEVRTCSQLHQNIWNKEHKRNKDKRFQGDYTQIPRGRIFEFKDIGFVVFTGDWIEDFPNVKNLIMEEFDLPKNTIFMKDSHWNIGHGWSNEF